MDRLAPKVHPSVHVGWPLTMANVGSEWVSAPTALGQWDGAAVETARQADTRRQETCTTQWHYYVLLFCVMWADADDDRKLTMPCMLGPKSAAQRRSTLL